MIKDINKLGENVARRITSLEGLKEDVEDERRDIGADLRVIWEALENGQPVNGATNKKEWCAFAKITPRYAQYLVRDGSRKRKKDTNRVRVVVIKEGMLVSFGGEKFTVQKASLQSQTIHMIVRLVEEKQPEVTAKSPKKKEPLRHIKDGNSAVSLCGVWHNDKYVATKRHPANCKKCLKLSATLPPEPPAVPAPFEERERTVYMKKYRAAKRAAKFYVGMMKELNEGVDRNYGELLKLWGGDQRSPWTPPTKDYFLPSTLKVFEAQYDAATETFNTLLQEGINRGWMTTEPRKKEEPLSEPAKALAAAEKPNTLSKETSGEAADTSAKTEQVKMARIDNTNEFGVFPESCWKCTTANALTIGTRQECEAERDRINAKRIAKNDSVENLVAHGDAHQNQQQHPAAEALEKALDSKDAVEVSDEQHDEEQCEYSEEQVAAMFAQGGK